MAQTLQKTRVVGNPAGRKKYRRASNPGDILGFTLAAGNPGRKGGKKMAKKHHAKKHASRRSGTSKYKRNTGRAHSTKGHTRRYKRNAGSMGGGIGPVLTTGVSVIAGAVGSKLGTQMILGAKNTGALGYAGNAAVGGILWFLAEKFMRNRTVANGLIAGTAVQLLLRAINDYTPFGQYVNSLGMGDYQMQSFVTPQVLVDPMNSAEVAIPSGWAPQIALPAPSSAPSPAQTMTATAGGGGNGAGMSGLYGGGWGGGLYG